MIVQLNRNVEDHFSRLPQVDIQRSIFDRSYEHKFTGNVGDLIPCLIEEVLPGDSVSIKTSKVVRLQTLLTPIFSNMYLDTYFFFVPNRLVYDHWEELCGENKTGPWAPQVKYYFPQIKSPVGGFATGTVADYMGLPVGVEFGREDTDTRRPTSLPFRAYALVCDQYFRDANLCNPLNIPKGDAITEGTNEYDPINGPAAGGLPYRAAKYHDYYTSVLPQPQRGDPVNILSNFKMPVHAEANLIPPELNTAPIAFTGVDGSMDVGGPLVSIHRTNFAGNYYAASTNGGSSNLAIPRYTGVNIGDLPNSATADNLYPVNLWAVPDTSVTLNVNDLRLGFALQRFAEKAARNGSNRYIEFLLAQYNVTSPDARLQRAEYLGGNRVPLQIAPVTNMAQSEQDFLGDLGANSVTADVNFDVPGKSFTEHGYLIGVCVCRYDHAYSQGIDKFWMRHELTDIYLPVFANLGELPVYKSELFATNENMQSKAIFGYQEAWAEYRYGRSRISGEFRPGIPNSLASWHLGDYYDAEPTLSDTWILEDKSNVDRVLAVSSDVSHQMLCDFYFDMKWTRPLPTYSIPGLIDHN